VRGPARARRLSWPHEAPGADRGGADTYGDAGEPRACDVAGGEAERSGQGEGRRGAEEAGMAVGGRWLADNAASAQAQIAITLLHVMQLHAGESRAGGLLLFPQRTPDTPWTALL
jgi:hypothetical protein